MFKSEDNDKNNIVTSHLQLIGIKSSVMSGDTKAKEDARYIINCNILRGMSQNCVDLDQCLKYVYCNYSNNCILFIDPLSNNT